MRFRITPAWINLCAVALLLSACNNVDTSSGDDPKETILVEAWGDRAVRKVLHTFAYGGHADDQQISRWAGMNPVVAIKEILSFDVENVNLSPKVDKTVSQGGTLRELMGFWSSSHPDNPYVQSKPYAVWHYDTFYTYPDTQFYPNSTRPVYYKGQTRMYNTGLQRTWAAAINKRGLNPVRQKFGLFLTHYHMAVSLSKVKATLIRTLYDDSLDLLAAGEPYQRVLARGAYSAAVSMQYAHRLNKYDNSQNKFVGNDDFAREFHQLFFRILGDGEDPDYHENTTIEHTAWVLTGMELDRDPNINSGRSLFEGDHWVAPINFSADHPISYKRKTVEGYKLPDPNDPTMLATTNHARFVSGEEVRASVNNVSNHYRGSLQILRQTISGNSAKEKLIALADIAIETEESLNNLPVYVIEYFADDNLTEAKIAAIRELWRNNSNHDMLKFLRDYAISPMFLSHDTYKFKNAINRNMTTYNLVTVDNVEAYYNLAVFTDAASRQGFRLFTPAHDVFGGQTAMQASNNPDVFKNAYNDAIQNYWRIVRTTEWQRDSEGQYPTDSAGKRVFTSIWEKNWASVIPTNAVGVYRVKEIGEWLWNRFIGDGLENYSPLERAYVNSFLATDFDLGFNIAPDNADIFFSVDELTTEPLLSYVKDHENRIMNLASSNINTQRVQARRIGRAISFISTTPFSFVIGGGS